MEGFRWYVKDAIFGEYEPVEKTFSNMIECIDSIIEHGYDIKNTFIGIDYCSDDNGVITIIKKVVKAC